jgi:hypothetical protein
MDSLVLSPGTTLSFINPALKEQRGFCGRGEKKGANGEK